MNRKLLLKHSPVKKGSEKRIPKNMDKTLENYTEIVKGLWLGNYKAAKDKTFFTEKAIKGVLNMTEDLPNTFRDKKDIEYMRISVDDSLKEKDFKKMTDYIPVGVAFIHKQLILDRKRGVLVNCFAGRQRSACIVACFLMKYNGLTPSQAVSFITKRRLEAFYYGESINFEKSMDEYYKTLHKK
jgi:hypothetical protein